ncbi:MAG: SEC-C metal-binding domain-containing protein [Elusimicrobiota bacterium]
MIDTAWKEHLYDLDQVKKGIGLRAYAQKDPKIEYQKESFAMFELMIRRIREATLEYIFKVQISVEQPIRRQERVETRDVPALPNKKRPTEQTITVDKIGRNDPCPCGSGKKHKKCCGS